jgi:hypothetical protein
MKRVVYCAAFCFGWLVAACITLAFWIVLIGAVLWIASAMFPAISQGAVPDDLQSVSVTIKAGSARGSGTLVTREVGNDTVTFVWTAAHVVNGMRTTRKITTADGTMKTLVEYKDVQIVQEQQQDGRRVGEVQYDCKVLKVSDADYGHDLAILMVRRRGAYPVSVSAKFHTEKNYIPPIGAEIAHCGSMLGQFGANSYTEGVLSQTGRTLDMEGANRQTFDQVTTVAFPGSSGGGMYLKDSGVYVGMLTQGVTRSQGFNFLVPIRRMHEWAAEVGIEWALDPSVPMPAQKELDEIHVEDEAPSGFSFIIEPA